MNVLLEYEKTLVWLGIRLAGDCCSAGDTRPGLVGLSILFTGDDILGDCYGWVSSRSFVFRPITVFHGLKISHTYGLLIVSPFVTSGYWFLSD